MAGCARSISDNHVPIDAEFLPRVAKGQADHLGKVQHRDAPGNAPAVQSLGLIGIQGGMTEGARGNDIVRVRPDRVLKGVA